MPGSLRGLLLATLLATPLAAQATGDVVLRGRVGDGSTGAGLVGAEVVLPGPGLVLPTDASGAWSAPPLPRGTYLVLVRSLGYAPWTGVISLTSADTATATFLLTPRLPIMPLAAELPELTVVGARGVSARMAEFERRLTKGVGWFLTRDALARREHSRLSDVLRTAPGLRLVETSNVTQGVALTRNLLGSTPICYARIYLDGMKIYDPTSIGASVQYPPNLDGWPVMELEAIEVYRSMPETPIEFMGPGAECGTLLLWTRAPPR